MDSPQNTDETEHNENNPSHMKSKPPDGGYGWIVCFAVFMCNLLSHGPLYCFGILFQSFIDEFDSSHTSVAFVGSAMVCFKFSAPIFASPFINKYGCRTLCRFASLLSVVGFSMTAMSPNLPLVFLGYGIFGGIGLGISFLASIVQCNEYFEKRRSIAIGLAMCGSSLSILVMGPWSNYILVLYGWRTVVWSYALFSVICFALGLLLRPLQPEYEDGNKSGNGSVTREQQSNIPLVPYQELSELPNNGTYMNPISMTLPSNSQEVTNDNSSESNHDRNQDYIKHHMLVFRRATTQAFQPVFQPLFKVWIFHKLFVYFALFTPFTFLPNMIIYRNETSEHPIYRQQIGAIISLIGGGDALGRLLCGFACDYYGMNALTVTTVVCLLASVSTFIMIFCQSFVSYAICGALYGIAIGPIAALSSTILVDLFGIGSLAPNYSLVLFFQGIFTIPGVVLGGYLFQCTHSYQLTFGLASICFIIGSTLSHVTNVFHQRKKEHGHQWI